MAVRAEPLPSIHPSLSAPLLTALLTRAFSRVGRSGGTPNLSNAVRAIPQSQFVPHWYRLRFVRSLPRTIYNTLSEHGQRI